MPFALAAHAGHASLGGQNRARTKHRRAKNMIESAHLIQDPTLLTALEALLNVLPPAMPSAKKKPDASLSGAANDFQALERLRKLAFADTVPQPKAAVQEVLELVDDVADDE
jgi:hypothetical protein